MKGACVGSEEEAAALRAAAKNTGRSDWEITCVELGEFYVESTGPRLLDEFDFLIIPLSLPLYWSIKLPIVANEVSSKCKVILRSGSDGDPEAFRKLYDGYFQRTASLEEILAAAEKASSRARSWAVTEMLIARLTETVSSLRKTKLSPGEILDYRLTVPSSYQEEVILTTLPLPITRCQVFISYCHKDEKYREMIATHLGVPEHQGFLYQWDDRHIPAGDLWQSKIYRELAKSRLAILVVTANFLNSAFILNEEIPTLIQQHADWGMDIVPVLARPCAWQLVPWLSAIQMRPTDAVALSELKASRRDRALADLASEVQRLLRDPR